MYKFLIFIVATIIATFVLFESAKKPIRTSEYESCTVKLVEPFSRFLFNFEHDFVLKSAYEVRSNCSQLGGFSAIRHMYDQNFKILSDAGYLIHAEIPFRQHQVIEMQWGALPLLASTTTHISTMAKSDVESFIFDNKNIIAVAEKVFDQDQKPQLVVLSERERDYIFSNFIKDPGFNGFTKKTGAEAVVKLANNCIAYFSEHPIDGVHQARVICPSGSSRSIFIKLPDGYAISDAATTNSGDVIFLLRKIGLQGFTAGLFKVSVKNQMQNQWFGTFLYLGSSLDGLDNMEGIDIFNVEGREHIVLISDNNFNYFQRSLVFVLQFNTSICKVFNDENC